MGFCMGGSIAFLAACRAAGLSASVAYYGGAIAKFADEKPKCPIRGVDSLGFVMDVPVELTVEIGRKTMRIGEILRLGPGSVLELDKASGEPLDVYANGRLIARGEAVVVGERYGVRLTEVLVMDDSTGRKS
jgi:flagellar motor switch protein FliN/FliY